MAAPLSYLLCATPRTGSTLLCSLLSSTGVAGRPESYFREPDQAMWAARFGVPIPTTNRVDYLRFVAGALEAGRTANGVFAARIMWGTMRVLVDGLADERGGRTDLEVLGDALGPLCFVHLQRQDVVEQAVSWARAEQSGYWQQGDARCAEPRFDLDQIEKLVRTIREHNAAWRAWFIDQGVEVLAVTYESMAANPSDTVRCIVEAIGASLPTGWSAASPHKKQADAINEDWVKRYKDEAAVQPHQ